MHEMSSKIDEGKIVKRIEIPLEFYDSWIEINEKILKKTERMVKNFIPKSNKSCLGICRSKYHKCKIF